MFQHIKKAVRLYFKEAARNYVWSALPPEAFKDKFNGNDEEAK